MRCPSDIQAEMSEGRKVFKLNFVRKVWAGIRKWGVVSTGLAFRAMGWSCSSRRCVWMEKRQNPKTDLAAPYL